MPGQARALSRDVRKLAHMALLLALAGDAAGCRRPHLPCRDAPGKGPYGWADDRVVFGC